MNNRFDIWSIDAHSKRVRGADDAKRAGAESLLNAGTLRVGKTGVIGSRVDTCGLQRLDRSLCLSPGRRIDERASRAHELRQKLVLFDVTRHRPHRERDIRPIESGDDDMRIVEAEELDDIVTHLRRCGRRERSHRRTPGAAVAAPAGVGGFLQSPVVRPEVMAPLGHAVRLVDDEARDRNLLKRPNEMV